jgi:MFS family permease
MEIEIKRNRIAVSIFFFVNGFLHANLMARLPLFQSNLDISNSVLGSLLFVVAIGALIGMPITGRLAAKHGSDKMATTTALLFCIFIAFIPYANNVWLAGIFLFFMGMNMGAMDVCMNGQAVFVERLWNKPIMSSFHAIFSIGVASGAGIGALVSKLETLLTIHVTVLAIICFGLILWASTRLIKETSSDTTSYSKNEKGWSFPSKAIFILGLIAFCCMTGEGSMTDWSALYMHQIVGQDTAFSAITYGVYAIGMTIGRIFGDVLTESLGRKKLMIYDALLAIAGLSIALLYVSVPTTLIGFFMVGLGVSTIVPIVFSAAGNTEGIHPSEGIAMATSIGYTGFFIGPPAIGFLSDLYDLRIGLGVSLLLFCLMLFLIVKFVKVR